MSGKSFTAPLCLMRSGGQVIGKGKNVRVSESFRRGKVMSLGNAIPDELPMLEWSGTLSMSFYTIDFKNNPIVNAMVRQLGSVQAFVDNILLNEIGIDIDIYKKVKVGTGLSNTSSSDIEKFASIVGAFVNRENFDISEGQISGRDVDFDYLSPILY